ncbi:pleckstrin-like protein domain-containing family b member 2 [Biomphalaria glabrata]|uniref:Uncharacterized protein LOC106065308 n=1 Tax=Biomphalaria glabrata TaxID=6526 RepID=A0A9U8EAJ3_BIOGL|nr:uncharacterized protein LOC106065308 [Biomphalaria glabrata]KAI8769395.1 trithorax group protein osa isoform X2 [Biomphalaria glabrata]KAI8789725.1 trithorax group protein osa isoform X2 [Biomphalaria glabrata]
MGDVGHRWPESTSVKVTRSRMKTFPVAVGPCKLYQKPSISRWVRCGPMCLSCPVGSRNDNGVWKECHLKLFSDSTLKIYAGFNGSSELLSRMILKRIYKEIVFGNDLQNIMNRPDVPDVSHGLWDSILAIPEDPYYNGNICWLDFTTQETLHKWLVAICSTLPVKQLRGSKRSRCTLDVQKSAEVEQVGDDMGLQSYIDIFFRRRPSCGKAKRKAACLIDISRTSVQDKKELLQSSSTVSDV